jgi:hypothetical protein
MLAYRECSRSLWNTTLRCDVRPYEDFDAIDAFAAIGNLLFKQVVLVPLGRASFARARRQDPVPFLRLRPIADPLPIMVNRPSPDGNMYWDDPATRLRAKGLSLLFVDYFDWDQFGYIDVQYYRVRIESCEEFPHLVGRAALVDVHHAEVECLDGESTDGRPSPDFDGQPTSKGTHPPVTTGGYAV